MPPILGAYRTIETAEGAGAPFYIIPFDKKGRCKAPRTRQKLLDTIRHANYSHIFIFSHGWNNDWETASERYFDFAGGFTQLRREMNLSVSGTYRPLLIGVFWPSTSLVLPWERAPDFAADEQMSEEVASAQDAIAKDEDQLIADVAADLPSEQVERFYELMDADRLVSDEALELAGIIGPLLGDDDELGDAGDITAGELLRIWRSGSSASVSEVPGDDDDGFSTVRGVSIEPEAAGWAEKLDPRRILRLASVWRMKDRAGKVGARGVSPLLIDILSSGDHSVHLIGHSYGSKVVLSATGYKPLPRTVESMLLLQPAVSHLCFTSDVDGKGRAGGYRPVLQSVRQPVITTFSKHDSALTKHFHLALRRDSDLGEERIASGAPSRYAALGGFGPGGLHSELETVPIRDPGEPYEELANSSIDVLALLGDRTINGHGDVSNRSTWWALIEQARRAGVG
jgi:hypothetical protein